MGTKHTSECLANARDDEPIFVLRSQDQLAPAIVRRWADAAERAGVDEEKVVEARQQAKAMEDWGRTRGSKVPD